MPQVFGRTAFQTLPAYSELPVPQVGAQQTGSIQSEDHHAGCRRAEWTRSTAACRSKAVQKRARQSSVFTR